MVCIFNVDHYTLNFPGNLLKYKDLENSMPVQRCLNTTVKGNEVFPIYSKTMNVLLTAKYVSSTMEVFI